MILFLQMAGSLSASFGALVKLVPSAISAATAAGRIMAVTELPREDRSQDKEAWELLEENRADGIRVETRDLVFRYQDGDVVLDGANFYADPGEIVALVGPLGRGKDHHAPLLLFGHCGRRRGMWRSQGRERARAHGVGLHPAVFCLCAPGKHHVCRDCGGEPAGDGPGSWGGRTVAGAGPGLRRGSLSGSCPRAWTPS